MWNVFKPLVGVIRPALLVAFGLVVIAGVCVLWFSVRRNSGDVPAAVRTSTAEESTATRENHVTPPVAATSAPAAEGSDLQEILRAAEACLAANPPDLERAASLLAGAEETALAARQPASWPDVPTSAELRKTITAYQGALAAALQAARDPFDVDAVRARLDDARKLWNQPGVAACQHEIERQVLERALQAQSAGAYDVALELVQELRRLTDNPYLASLVESLKRLAEAKAATGTDRVLGRQLLAEVRAVLERSGIHGNPRAREAPAAREALHWAAACLAEAERLGTDDADRAALADTVEAWQQAAESPANVLLAMVTDGVDLVGLADLERLREWPTLPAFLAEWFASGPVSGPLLRGLAVEPLGAGSHVCFAGALDLRRPTAAVTNAPPAEKHDTGTTALRSYRMSIYACGIATHLRWDAVFRVARAIAATGAALPVHDDPEAHELTLPSGLCIWEAQPGFLLVGRRRGAAAAGESNELKLPDGVSGDRAFDRFLGPSLTPVAGTIWETARPDERSEDVWLATRRVPLSWEQALHIEGLARAESVLITARLEAGAILVQAFFTFENGSEASDFEEALLGVTHNERAVSDDDGALGRTLRRVLQPAQTHIEGSTVHGSVRVPNSELTQLVTTLRDQLSPTPGPEPGP